MLKKLISALLVIIMVVSIAPMKADAAFFDNTLSEREYNGSRDMADIMEDGDTIEATLSSYSDEDYFKIYLDETTMAIVQIIIKDGDATIQLLNRAGAVIADGIYLEQDKSEYTCYYILEELNAGEYYIRVKDSQYYYSTYYVYYYTDQHEHEYEESVTEPTCSSQGYTTYTCECGKTYVDNYTDPKHIFDDDNDAICNSCEYNKVAAGWVLENNEWVYYENGFKAINTWKADAKGWRYLGEEGYCLKEVWKADSKGWCYLGSDGYMAKNKWIQDDGVWYFIKADGYMAANYWKDDTKGWCYLDSNGKMAVNKWVKDSKGWCYLGSDGYMVKNQWIKDNGAWYFIKSDGRMATSYWKADSKGWCYLDSTGKMAVNTWVKDSKGWCYLGSDGYMVKNQWINDKGTWYFIKSDGRMAANYWKADSKGWCYLDSTGKMAVNQWIQDSKGWCYLGSDGYMVKNRWVQSGDDWYLINANGYMVANKWAQSGSKWHYLGSNGKMVKKNWVQDGGKWYYVNSDGVMTTNSYWTIDGALYYFESDGSMRANQTFRSGYIGSDGKIGDECFAYLVASDFRAERSKYSNTTPRMGYVHAEVKNGALWVVTAVFYRLGSYKYEIYKLHDLTNGQVITEPSDYYDKLANRSYGATRIKYLGYATDVLDMQIKALKGPGISPEYLAQ